MAKAQQELMDPESRHLAALNRIAMIAVQDLSVRPMLQRIVDTLAAEFGWEFVACASIDHARQEFVCEALSSRVDSQIRVGYRRALGSGVVGECASTGRSIDIDDARQHPNLVDTLGGTLSELCVPVMHNGLVLAVLNAESRELGSFRGQRLLLETVACQVAGVLYAAHLLEELASTNLRLQEAYRALETTSRLDPLTGIANRRRFDYWLAEAADGAQKRAQPMALLLVDVDHFKAYNDNFGHPEGDACLKRIAGCLLAALGDEPTVRLARYGGEEFVLLATDTDAAGALVLGERLRLAIEDAAIPHAHSPRGHITISVGVAAGIPDDEAQVQAQLAAADAALYRAKQNGRNYVRAAD
jgi:diguanylate cyclase (GGDEF)-like protein